jgi:hypothetical protein
MPVEFEATLGDGAGHARARVRVGVEARQGDDRFSSMGRSHSDASSRRR